MIKCFVLLERDFAVRDEVSKKQAMSQSACMVKKMCMSSAV
jgi:hypothetical protein